jgi:hypothetical protein
MTGHAKVQRLLKRIEDNAKSDRAEANELLKKAKASISDILAQSADDENGLDVDSLTKLIQAAVTALNQSGSANEKLLKLVAIIQRSVAGVKTKDPASPGKAASPFETLAFLTSNKNEDDED